MRMPNKLLIILLSSLICGLFTPLIHAKEPIKIGMSAAFSGPAKTLGEEMKTGISAVFNEVNASGGIQGQPIEFITLDDQYEPLYTEQNVLKLIEDHQVVSLIGNVGTPTTVTVLPLLNQNQTPLVGPFTGASSFRNAQSHPFVFHYRASYAQETSNMIHYLLKAGLKMENIAILSQDDSYGNAGFFGIYNALKSHNLDPSSLLHIRYPRNTLQVEMALAEALLSERKIQAFIMVGAYKPVAKFIKLTQPHFPKARFLNVSFVGSESLAKQAGHLENIYITQVVPNPNDISMPIVQAFQQSLSSYFPNKKPTLGAFEGYIVGKIMVKALQKVKGKITRKTLYQALKNLPNLKLGLNSALVLNQHSQQFSNQVWLSKIKNHKIQFIDWERLKYEQ